MKVLACIIPSEKKTKYEVLFQVDIPWNSKINFFSKYNFLANSVSVGIRKYDEDVDSHIENSLELYDLEWIKNFYVADMYVLSEKRKNKLIFIKYDGLENKKINVKNYIIFKTNNMIMNRIKMVSDEKLYYNISKDFAFYIFMLNF